MGILSTLGLGRPAHSRLMSVGRLILLAGAVGVVAGLGAMLFHFLCNLVVHLGLDGLGGYRQYGAGNEHGFFEPTTTPLRPLLLLAIPTLGGLLSGFLVYTFAPEAEGHGTDAAIDAYHNRRGRVRGRVPIIKTLASAITIGTGGSGGREGPIAQIGAGFGSFLATRLGLSDHERRVLLAAGMGAGIGAIFHAPLAGAIFAIEVLYREPDFESEALIPAFMSTTVAYSTFGLAHALFGLPFAFEPLFNVGPIAHPHPLIFLPLTVLVLVMVAASFLYVKCFYGFTALFHRLPVPRQLRPAVGALLTGAAGLGLYFLLGRNSRALNVLSFGYGVLQDALHPDRSILADGGGVILLLLVVGLGKILTTSLTIGSGGSGGVFGPSMVIGGCLGAVVGLALQSWWPAAVPDVRVFVILGMAGFFSAAANTPVSTLIIVSELTGSYTLLLPSMWVCALSYMLARGWTLYRSQLPARIDSPAHRGDFIIDVLEGLTVRDAWRPAEDDLAFTSVPHDMRLAEVVRLIAGTRQTVFPVVDRGGELLGVFSMHDIRQYLYDKAVGEIAVAEDVARVDVPPLSLDASLPGAMERFGLGPYEELPVVDPQAPRKVVGLMREQDVIAAYNAQLVEMRKEQ